VDGGSAHLEVSGLTKRFGGLVAVKGMTLAIEAGKILGLIGPNGSGKSTVMKLIMGIERPDAGSVRVNGVEVAGWPSHRIARMGAGIVFQHSRPLHRQTVLENIKLALLPDKLLRLIADPQTDDRARAIAERVGLSAVLDRRPATLPFADLRKIEIAKAIARDPKVLLIDEPFAGLTPKETAAFSDLICELRDDGRAVLLVDHNVKSVARLVDSVIAMYVGERIAEGTADEVMRNETVRRVYLGGSTDRRAPGILVRRYRHAVSGSQQRQRQLRQGASAPGRVDPRPCRRIRFGGGTEWRGENHAVQHHFRPAALCGRHSPRRRNAARPLGCIDRPRRHRAVSRGPRAFHRHDGARESRSRRPASAAGRKR
jgi:ABC-type branched-subunit amino acid transport system ATPase component